MATVFSAEKSIYRVEGFNVRFRFEGPARALGRDVRSDKQNVPTYTYQRAAAGTITVAAWVDGRFRSEYPGFAAEVLDADDRVVNGQTLLKTVRATYL